MAKITIENLDFNRKLQKKTIENLDFNSQFSGIIENLDFRKTQLYDALSEFMKFRIHHCNFDIFLLYQTQKIKFSYN